MLPSFSMINSFDITERPIMLPVTGRCTPLSTSALPIEATMCS